MELKPGMRLKSVVCDAEVMVVKVTGSGSLACGGEELQLEATTEKLPANEDQKHGCVIGKRYVNESETIEVLCVKSGDGSLYFGTDELMTKDTKKLPSSD